MDLVPNHQLSSNTGHQPYKASSSSPEAQGLVGGRDPRHRRGYQACQRCRDRKVKCDLGSVDAPHEPPCARCKRERLHCTFTATRKKRKESEERLDEDERPAAKRHQPLQAAQNLADSYGNIEDVHTRPHAFPANQFSHHWQNESMDGNRSSQGLISPQGRPHDRTQTFKLNNTHNNSMNKKGQDVQLHSQIAAETLRTPVASTQDSIKLLVDAANALPDDSAAAFHGGTPSSDRATRAKVASRALAGGPPETTEEAFSPEEQIERRQALKAWARMRFVRAGWFTAEEAMNYVDYFYDQLAPMTPVVTPNFRPHSRHHALLSEEPVLAITILAISSRHLKPVGYAAVSRSYQIHDKLWVYLRSMIERLLWAQEQFGGGFCGGGAAKVRESPGGQITWKGSLRTLGTIEALLLLTDWQPRALHFPPGDDDDRLLANDYDLLSDVNGGVLAQEGDDNQSDDFDNVPYAGWLEPAWRSDKMSWMLLGLAQALSFELGVFDVGHEATRYHHDSPFESARKQRLRRLVLVYVAQTSGRIGIPSMLQISDWEGGSPPGLTIKTMMPGQTEDPTDIMQSFWIGIAGIMNKANREIFPSRQFTRELTSSGRYKQSIAEFAPLLQRWKQRFEQVLPHIHPVMQSILRMEYEYARLYINSLGLQNVVESWVGHGSNMEKSTLVKIAEINKPYIDEVTEAALSILSIVIHGLGAGGHIRDAPVRTYLRSLSGMMFTLKRFSLGNHENSVRKSLTILGQMTDAMSKEVVDDVHLSSHTSRLVQMIVKYVKQTLIRVHKPANGSGAPSRDQSRQHSPHRNDNNGSANQSLDQMAPNFAPDNQEYYLVDPLAEIQARPMADFSAQTFMPPPNFNIDAGDQETGLPENSNFDQGTNDLDSADWLTLPLDNLWNNTAATVDQGFGGIGPTVGPRDMLELITNQDYNQMQWNASNSPFNGYGGM